MQRRDFVKAVVAASLGAKSMLAQQKGIAPPNPSEADDPEVPKVRGLMVSTKPLPVAVSPDALVQTAPHFFTEHQMATLHHLCEILMPPLRGYPGALDAGAPAFLDFLISVSPLDRQHMYQSGLDRLDAESRQHFGVSFAQATPSQADQLLRPWLKVWMADHPPMAAYEHFINVAHLDIRTATMNSQAWNKAVRAAGEKDHQSGLFWYPVDPDLHRKKSAPIRPAPRSAVHS